LPEGDFIGYGHKLTKGEKASGFILVDEVEHSFADGDSEVTELIATKILAQDKIESEQNLQREWKNFESLTDSQKQQLIIIRHSGKLVGDKAARVKKAIDEGQEDLMAIE
jgi:hypothetical protein